MKQLHLVALFAATASLAGCGGGDDAPAPPPVTEQVPGSASTSSAGLVSYLVALSNASADDKEPVSLDTFNPVTPDDTEPEAVN